MNKHTIHHWNSHQSDRGKNSWMGSQGAHRVYISASGLASGFRLWQQVLQCLASNHFHALYSTPADMFLIESVLNPAAKLPRGIVLPARNRAKLHAQRHADWSKRFDSQYAGPVNQNG